MPWTSSSFQSIENQAKELIKQEFGIAISSKVFLCSKRELIRKVSNELENTDISRSRKYILLNYYLPFAIGKYFEKNDEIWLVDGKGDNIDTLIHEFLHSIQKCSPNREGIVDYLTYRITGNDKYISEYRLKDWQEIEKSHGYAIIKQRLLIIGDCEEF